MAIERTDSNIIQFRQRKRPNKLTSAVTTLVLLGSATAIGAGTIRAINDDNKRINDFNNESKELVSARTNQEFDAKVAKIERLSKGEISEENFYLLTLGSISLLVSIATKAVLEEEK